MSEEPSAATASDLSREEGRGSRSSTPIENVASSSGTSIVYSRNPDDIFMARVYLIITKIGEQVLRKILEVAISNSSLESLDELLKKNKKKIKSSKRFYPKEMFRELFPAEGERDVEKWDITLLSFVLLNCFDDLRYKIGDSIKEVREIKNKRVSHPRQTHVSEDEFNKFCDDFERVLNTLLTYLEETDRRDIQNRFLRYKQSDSHTVREELANDQGCPEEIQWIISSIKIERDGEMRPSLASTSRITIEGSGRLLSSRLRYSIKEEYKKWIPYDENIVRVYLIIIKVGIQLLRKILEVALSKSSCNSLDELLQKKEYKITSDKRYLHKDMFQELFPASGKADVERWDITLLSYVLLYVVNSLPDEIANSINELKEMKNKRVSHPKQRHISEEEFNEFCGDFECLLNTLLKFLKETDQQEIFTLYSEYKQNESHFVREEDTSDPNCPREIQMIINSVQKERDDIIDKLVDMLEKSPQGKVDVTVPLTLRISCLDEEKKENGIHTLKMVMEKAEDKMKERRQNSDSLEELVIEFLKRIVSLEVKLKIIQRESVVIYVQCFTHRAILALIESFLSEESGKVLEKISKELTTIIDTDINVQAIPMNLAQLQSLANAIEKQTDDEKVMVLKGKRKRETTSEAGLKFARTEEDTKEAVGDLDAKSEEFVSVLTAESNISRIKRETSGADIDQNQKLQQVPSFPRIICDPIHCHIELSPLCAMIVDTPQFQRLRYIKQLGHCYFVYPGASHNRFEHSLGTCHLAKQLVRALRSRQPELELTDKDELCIEIAALCHDLGHGPFSHPFEQQFIRQIHPSWKHQMASVEMFDHLIQANNLKPSLMQSGIGDEDIRFIKKLISPPKFPMSPVGEKVDERSFMYEIISNEINGIDVDKWDYFARDCHMSGIKNSFDHLRCIHFARVIRCPDGRKHICFRDKEASDLYEMYHTRSRLHRWLYQHKVCNTLNFMTSDALMLAKSHLTYIGENGKILELPDTIYDMTAYTRVNDDVFSKILNLESADPNVSKAKQILEDILSRRLYEMVTKKQLKFKNISLEGALAAKKEILQQYLRILNEKKKNGETIDVPDLTEDDIIVDPVNFDFGKGEENPIDFVWFYSKSNINEARRIPKDQVSFMLPTKFAEQQLRLFCKVKNKTVINLVKEAFSYWCYDKELPGQN